ADAAIVTEPTELDVCVAHKGFVWLQVETHGRAAHGSRPDLGLDAIAKMGRVLTGLEALDRRLRAGAAHPLLGTGSGHASLLAGGQERSSYPERCRVEVERRTIPGETAERVEREIRALLDEAAAEDPELDADIRVEQVQWPLETAADGPVVQATTDAVRAATGRRPALFGA